MVGEVLTATGNQILVLKAQSSIAHDDLARCISVYKNLKNEQRNATRKAMEIKAALKNLGSDIENEELQVCNRVVDADAMQQSIEEMNEQQQMFFDLVVRAVADREAGGSPKHYYCSGTAGTGKTYVIDCLADYIEFTYGNVNDQMSLPSVLLAAPTGLAAISIKGQTIHSLFGIKVQTSSYSPYEPLSDEQRDRRRTLFQNVKLIIIDEISMVGAIMLQKINLRLKEIMGSSEDFGGVCVATFGDLLQLPPVKSPPVFAGLTRPAARKIFSGCGVGTNLWHQFRFYELTINMRQKEDPAYADILGRLRMGSLTPDDVKVLSERIIEPTPELTTMEVACNHYLSLRTAYPKTMALFSKTAEVQEFNQRVVDSLGTLTISIASIDKELKIVRRRKQRPWQNRENSILNVRASSSAPPTALSLPTIAGGLTSNLVLTKNARVMLKRNIDQSKGLVNGLTGVLEEVIVEAGSVTKLSVRFDRIPNEVISITRVPVVYSGPRGSRHCRLQFPIELAYAVSIHKSQGLTLDSVMLSTE